MSTIYKYDLGYCLLIRCFSITSSYQKFNDEIYLLQETFKPDRYRIQFIDRFKKNNSPQSLTVSRLPILFNHEKTIKLKKPPYVIWFIKKEMSL